VHVLLHTLFWAALLSQLRRGPLLAPLTRREARLDSLPAAAHVALRSNWLGTIACVASVLLLALAGAITLPSLRGSDVRMRGSMLDGSAAQKFQDAIGAGGGAPAPSSVRVISAGLDLRDERDCEALQDADRAVCGESRSKPSE
jgi:hypothetical protein